MKSADDNDVVIEGFYEGRLPPTPGDEELVRKLVASLDAQVVLDELGVTRFKQDEVERALRARFFQAEFNISGLKAGYVNEDGHKMIVPHEAVAAMDMRPIDGMTIENMLASVRRHLDKHGYSDIEIEVRNSYLGGGSPPEDWAVQELLATYRDCGIEPQVWPRDPAAINAKQFTDLGMSWIASMPGHANRRHSANEYIQVEGYKRAIAFTARLFWRLANAPKR